MLINNNILPDENGCVFVCSIYRHTLFLEINLIGNTGLSFFFRFGWKIYLLHFLIYHITSLLPACLDRPINRAEMLSQRKTVQNISRIVYTFPVSSYWVYWVCIVVSYKLGWWLFKIFSSFFLSYRTAFFPPK